MNVASRTEIPILVLGSHRAGTSAVMGLLVSAGLDIGEPIPPGPENPKGFFESRAILQAHKGLLASVDSDWTCPPARLEPKAVDLTPLQDAIEAVRSPERRWGVKDPRLMFLLSAWAELVPAVEILGVYRDPAAVAASLTARDGFPTWVAQRIADAYTERLAALHRRLRFPIVHFGPDYEQLLKRVSAIAQAAELSWDDERAGRFISPDLIHHDVGKPSDTPDAAYLLEASGNGDQLLDTVNSSKLKRVLATIGGEATEELPRHFGPQYAINRRHLWDIAISIHSEIEAVLDIRLADSPPLPPLRRTDLDQIVPSPISELRNLANLALKHKPSHVMGCGVLDHIAPSELFDLFRDLDGITSSDAVVAFDGFLIDGHSLPSIHRWTELSRTSYADALPYHHHRDQIAANLLGTSWLLGRFQPPQSGRRGVLVLVKSESRQEAGYDTPASTRLQLLEARARLSELRRELATKQRILEATQRDLEIKRQEAGVSTEKLALLEHKVHEQSRLIEFLGRQRDSAADRYERLRARKSVRLALLVASALKPLFRLRSRR